MDSFVKTDIDSTFTPQQIVNLVAGKAPYYFYRLLSLQAISK